MERPKQARVEVGGEMPHGILYQPEKSAVETAHNAANGSLDFNKTRAIRHPRGLERYDPYGAPDPRMTPVEILGK